MEDLTSLIICAQSGNLDAFGMIVQRVQDMAVGYAHSILGDFHLAEDVAQEAFIGAYRDLNKLREPAAFPSWLRKLVFKHCDRLTRGMRLETIPLKAAVNLPSEEKDPAEAVGEKEMKDNVLAAISALPEKERVVTTLFCINGYSHQEIAEFLEVPATTVNHRLRASRKRLKGRLFTMVQDDLQEKRPSKDKRFANKVQLFNAAETGNVSKVRELLDSDATRAEEQRMSVEELVVWLIERHKKRVEWEATEGKKREKEWREKEKQLKVVPLLEELDPETAKQKAREFFEALINKDFEKANMICPAPHGRYSTRYTPKLEASAGYYSNVIRILSIGEPYQKEDKEGRRRYAGGKGIFIPYEIELADGTVRKGFISMRSDNDEREWRFDGGAV